MIASAIEPRRVIGSLAYFSTDIAEPGVIHHTEGNRISLGEPDGSRSERAKAIAEALIARRLALPGDDADPSRDLGEAARQRGVQSDQRADRRRRWWSWCAHPERRGWCARS